MKQARGSKLKNNWPVKKVSRLLFFIGEFGVWELLRVGAGVLVGRFPGMGVVLSLFLSVAQRVIEGWSPLQNCPRLQCSPVAGRDGKAGISPNCALPPACEVPSLACSLEAQPLALKGNQLQPSGQNLLRSSSCRGRDYKLSTEVFQGLNTQVEHCNSATINQESFLGWLWIFFFPCSWLR